MNIPKDFMMVYVKGKSEMRAVSHREEFEGTVLGSNSSIWLREVPVLEDGEQCMHTIDGKCEIVRAHWPDPKFGMLLAPKNSAPIYGTRDEDGM
jgi:hypothetical protein